MPFIVDRLKEWFAADRDSLMVSSLRYHELAGMFRTLCRRAGVTAHFHHLRHTFGCRWLAAGGDLLALQEAFGHSDLRLTQRYARLMERHVAAEASQIGELIEETVRKAVRAPEHDAQMQVER